MNIQRLPIEELSSDYGDIILNSVSGDVEVVITISGSEILHEIYSPDVNGMVYIRDIGLLAMMYDNIHDVSLENGLDGSNVKLDISFKEGSNTLTSSVTIYRCDAETGHTLDISILKRMPLSRVAKKTTGIGRVEFVSFYGVGQIFADVVHIGSVSDEIQTVIVGNILVDDDNYYRYDVSPAVIAAICNIQESDIVSYKIYKTENDSIRFYMDMCPTLSRSTFVFRNIFGAQESFTCTGDSVTEWKWSRNYGNINRKQIQLNRDLVKTVTVNTGYINLKTTGIIEDLLNSQSIYFLDEGVLKEIVIIEESFKITSRKDELISAEFKFKYSSNNQLQYSTNKGRTFDYTFDKSFY